MTHTCPFCKNPYLVADRVIPDSEVRICYQEHLDIGCTPTFETLIKNVADAMAKASFGYIS